MKDLLDRRWFILALIAIIVGSIYLGCVASPPSLMDDVDSVQAQISKTMLTSHDWVTARIDGVLYLEKSPLIYWLIAISYKMLGVSDWVARLPVALSSIALAVLTAAFGMWAFRKRAGAYAGLVIGTCVGLFLFTRIHPRGWPHPAWSQLSISTRATAGCRRTRPMSPFGAVVASIPIGSRSTDLPTLQQTSPMTPPSSS